MWLGVSNLPDYKPTFPKWKKNPNVGLAANLDSNGQDLLNKMLELDPTKRILARDALDHPYFDDLDKSKYNY
jgi:serine/threonine protein kinase